MAAADRLAMVEDLRADEIVVSSGSVATLASPMLQMATMVAAFSTQPWAAFLHANGRVVVRDTALREVRSLASGGSPIHLWIAPGDSDVVAGTKNFRSWATGTWKRGAYSWKSGFGLDPNLLALGRDARHAVVATSRELRVLDAASGERLASHAGAFGSQAIVLEDRFFVESQRAIQVRSLPAGDLLETIAPFPAPSPNALLALRPGTDRIVVGDGELRTVDVDARSLATRDPHDAGELATPELPRERWSAWDRVFTPDGTISVTSYGTDRWRGADHAVAWMIVRDAASGLALARLTVPFTSTLPRALAVSPDGDTVFFALDSFLQVSLIGAWTWR